MKNTWKALGCIGLFLGVGSFVQAADETWTGKISDNMCGASHAKMAGEHADAKSTEERKGYPCSSGASAYCDRVMGILLVA
jgi:hypothetical protein